MPITLYDAFVPSSRQVLGAVSKLIDKAEAHFTEAGLDPAEIASASLHPTMLPFAFQVKSVAQHSYGAIEGVRAGTFTPSAASLPTDVAGMRAVLADAAAGLDAVDPQELEGMMGRDMLFEMRSMRLPFTVESFLLSFSQPNFYFHAATGYDILRVKGVALGKADFLGQLRLKV